MVYLIGLWANVLPGLLLLLLVWRMAERLEPGYGAAAAVALGLGTMVLPLSTLLVLARLHGVPRLRRVRADDPRARRAAEPDAARAGRAAMGYAVSLGVPAVLRRAGAGAVPALAPRRADAAVGVMRRARARTSRAGSSGSCRCCSTTTTRFTHGRTWPTRTCPRQQKGFFGIGAPEPEGALDAAVRLARAADDLAGADHGGDRHGAALPPRAPRGGADDRRRLPLLRGLQLRLLPAVRGRLHGPALPDDDAAVPGGPAGYRFQAIPRPDDRAGGRLDHDDGDRDDHPPAGRL